MANKRVQGIVLLFICLTFMACVSNQKKPYPKMGRIQRKLEKTLRENTVKIEIFSDGKEVRSGSGFILRYKGKEYIITNTHVIGFCNEESIVIHRPYRNGEAFPFLGPVIVTDNEENDLTILTAATRVPSMGLMVQEERSMLEPILAAGFPSGAESGEEDITISSGKISNPRVEVEKRERIKLDMGVNPGNSGGPLVNEKGEVLGVIYMKYLDNTAYAIPISQVLEAIDGIENSSDEKIITDIVQSKLEQFMEDLVYCPPGEVVSADYFSRDFRETVNSCFYYFCKWSQNLADNNKLSRPPGPSEKYYFKFKEALLEIADDNDIFYQTGLGNSLHQKYTLVNSSYAVINQFYSEIQELLKIIEKSGYSKEKKETIKKNVFNKSISFYSKKLMSDLVYAHFGDIRNIAGFDVVRAMRDPSDKSAFSGIVRIKNRDGYDNVKVTLKYSHGKWAIASIGDGVLGEATISGKRERRYASPVESSTLKTYTKSPEAGQLYRGKSVPYRFWVNGSKWKKVDQPMNPESEYQFLFEEKLLNGIVLAEKAYCPLEAYEKVIFSNMCRISPGAKNIYREKRVVNGAEMLFLVLDVPEANTGLNYIFFYYLYSEKSFGSLQVVSFSLKELFEEEQDEVLEFLNGLEVLSNR